MRVACAMLVFAVAPALGAPATHPAMRPLPQPSHRPLGAGPAYYVDPASGDDASDGSPRKPWRTIASATKRLKAGDTLVLRGGVYFEAVSWSATGRAGAPITIRSAPDELAIIDAGPREFLEAPATAWEPYPGGAPGEYRSTKTYTMSAQTADDRGVFVTGNFADSMIPLHGYKLDGDLRSANQYWNLDDKLAADKTIYVGPGVWFDPKTKRIHIRLAHTTLASQRDANYRGETDPRRLALVIGADRTPLHVERSHHVKLQDIVLRGSATRTLEIVDSDHVELDRVTIYGGSPALYTRGVASLRMIGSVVRGVAAPWSSRASMKYRGNSAYLVVADNRASQSRDWELAYNDFTDDHDGLVLDGLKGLRFHHNRVENFNDDGLYLTFPPRVAPLDDVHIYENVFARIYTVFAFAEAKGGNAIGSGAYVFRNIFDLREGTYGWPAKDAAADAQPLARNGSRLCGDHGSPTWEPLFFYNNTVIFAETPQRENYGDFIAIGTRNSKRRVFDNIFFQLTGTPGMAIAGTDDLHVDGNLLWSAGAPGREFLDKFRASPAFEGSKRSYPAGWSARDIAADPRFVGLDRFDLRLDPKSPAVDAGVPIPKDWPDTLRAADKGSPDIGALPAGAAMLQAGAAAAPR